MTSATRRLAAVAQHVATTTTAQRLAPAAATTTTTAANVVATLCFGADGLVEMDPDLSVAAGHAPEELLRRRLASFEEHGFVIIDDFERHPLLPRMAAAARSVHALANAKVPLSLDSSRTYVHRASQQRGESKDEQWTGTPHVFQGEEAWAIRGILHPDWREYLGDEQQLWSDFLGSDQVRFEASPGAIS